MKYLEDNEVVTLKPNGTSVNSAKLREDLVGIPQRVAFHQWNSNTAAEHSQRHWKKFSRKLEQNLAEATHFNELQLLF